MRVPRWAAVTTASAAGVALAFTMTALPSSASSSGSRAWRACHAVAQRSYTHHQLRVCKAHPKLARLTPSPKSSHRAGRLQSKASLQRAVAAGKVPPISSTGSCPTGSGKHTYATYWDKKSLMGATQYRWHEVGYFCQKPNMYNATVTKVLGSYDYFSDEQSNVSIEKVTANTQGRAGDGSYGWIYREHHVELCILKYGCYANLYPHGKITAYAAFSEVAYSGSAG